MPTPVLMSPKLFSTRQRQRAPAHRSSSRSPPDVITSRLFPRRSPQRSSANADAGGLKPSPAGRLRRARQPPSLRTAPHPTRRAFHKLRLVLRVHVHNTTTVFSQRSMRRLEASLRRATPKGHETFISRTAPHQEPAPTSGPPCVQDTLRHPQAQPRGLSRESALESWNAKSLADRPRDPSKTFGAPHKHPTSPPPGPPPRDPHGHDGIPRHTPALLPK